jgi:hypothetical protein
MTTMQRIANMSAAIRATVRVREVMRRIPFLTAGSLFYNTASWCLPTAVAKVKRKFGRPLENIELTLSFLLRQSRRLLIVVLAVLCSCAPGGCNRSPESQAPSTAAAPPWFKEATKDVHLDFLHDAGPAGSYFMPQSIGSGGALFDFDQDGRLDIYLIQGAGPDSKSHNRLYHQQPDGGFRDVSNGSGLDVAGFGAGVAIGDVNNDGMPDVFLTEYGRIRLFVNRGNARFEDVSREAGVESLLWGTSASFLDFDRDGWLDLVVTNYVAYDATRPCYGSRTGARDFCSPTDFGGSLTLLYRNATKADPSATPKFENVTEKSGLGTTPGPGLGLVCADFNHDGWDDIFVANDQQPNRLWINQHDGTFLDEALSRGAALDALGRAGASMGTAWGDVNDDGLADLFVTKLDIETHTLWRQGPAGLFVDGTADAALATAPRNTGFGAALADFDLDGDLDLAYVNGRVLSREPVANDRLPAFWQPYAERNCLFTNDGKGRFELIAEANRDFCGAPEVSRGLCAGDIDNDGDVDLLVTTIAGPARLHRNVAPRKGHWLAVRAIDPALKRDAYGAVVTVKAGEHSWQRLVNPGLSFQSSHDPRAHFGLGNAERVDEIRVRWPDGATEAFPGGAVDRMLALRKGEGTPP